MAQKPKASESVGVDGIMDTVKRASLSLQGRPVNLDDTIQAREWMLALSIIAAALATLFALPVWAQTQANTTETIEGLHKVADMMEPVYEFFVSDSAAKQFPNAPASKKRVPPSDQDYADHYRKMKDVTGLFLRLASEQQISRATDYVGQVYETVKLPKPPTLQVAIEEAEKRRIPNLTMSVASSLRVAFYHAWQGLAADVRYGPIIDNPKFYDAVKPPTSGMELLRNTKWALDNDALLRVDFFTSENMKRFLGMAAPVIRTLDDITVRWETKPSAADLAALPPDVAERARCIYIVKGSLQADGNLKSGNLDFNCNYVPNRAYPTFDEVVEVFGHRWRSAWEVNGPPLHGMPPPPTAAHGNEDMVYEFRGAPYRGRHVWRQVLARFGPDASFGGFSLSEAF
jgi:hypothetical protein